MSKEYKRGEEEEELKEEDDTVLVYRRESRQDTLLIRVNKILSLITSTKLLPLNIKNSPWTRPILFLFIVLFIFAPIKQIVMVTLLSFVLGYMIGVPSANENDKSNSVNVVAMLNELYLSSSSSSSKIVIEDKDVPIFDNSLLDLKLSSILERLTDSLIHPWFSNICKSGDREFYRSVKATMKRACFSFQRQISNQSRESVSILLYGLASSLTSLMKDYKEYEAILKTNKHLKVSDFLPFSQSAKSYHSTDKANIDHQRQLAGVILRSLLPKQESKSINLIALLKETLASGLLWTILDRVMDPDMINLLIIKAFPPKVSNIPHGYTVLSIRIVKGKDMPILSHENNGGFYFILHVTGCHRVHTRRIRLNTQDEDCIWNQKFYFDVPNEALDTLKVHIQFMSYRYSSEKDLSLGYAKCDNLQNGQFWLKFPTIGERIPQIFVDISLISASSSSSSNLPKHHASNNTTIESHLSNSTTIESHLSKDKKREEAAKEEYNPELHPPLPSNHPYEPNIGNNKEIGLEAALQNNELFMEFYEYLQNAKAPPYLQFMMNVDAYRQFAAIEIHVDPSLPILIEDYFRKAGKLTEEQREQLKMLRRDALDIYLSHFAPESKYRIPIDRELLRDLEQNIQLADKVDETGDNYVGGPIGPNIFAPIYIKVLKVLNDVYYPRFKESLGYQRIMDHASRFSTLQFTIDDDRVSTYSLDNPTNVTISNNPNYTTSIHSTTVIAEEEEEGEGNVKIDTSTLEEEELSSIANNLVMKKEELEVVRSKHPEKNTKKLENEIKAIEAVLQSKANELSGLSEDFWMNLANVNIKIEQIDEKETGLLSYLSVSTNSNPRFQISLLRKIKNSEGKEEELNLSTVTRSYLEFEEIYRKLKKSFSKVGKLEFPAVNSKTLPQKLSTFMQLVCSDGVMRQSPLIREFVTLDSSEPQPSSIGRRFFDNIVGQRTSEFLLGKSNVPQSGREKFYQIEKERFTVAAPVSNSKLDLYKDLRQTRSVDNIGNADAATIESLPLSESSLPFDEENRISSLEQPPPPPPSLSPPSLEVPLYKIGELEEDQIEMLLETTFKFIMEAFDLNQPNQWLRRRLLAIFKRLLKQAYGDSISKSLSSIINHNLTESRLYTILCELESFLWPNNVFIKDVPLPIRTEDQQFATMLEAKSCWLKMSVPTMESVTGHYNAIAGLNRIFNMLQEKEFTKTMMVAIMDLIVLSLFAERPPHRSNPVT